MEREIKRTIKFRAWNRDNQEPMFDPLNSPNGLRFDTILRVPSIIVMQFTGLKDNKRTKDFPEGQEIYEGDIYMDKDGNIGQIFFCYGAFTMGKDKPWSDPMGWDMYSDKEYYKVGQHHPEKYQIEVIGNLHENPELIK